MDTAAIAAPPRGRGMRPSRGTQWVLRLLVGAALLVAALALTSLRSEAAVTCNSISHASASQTLSGKNNVSLVSVTVDDTSSGGAQSVLIAQSGVTITVNGSACGTAASTNEVDVQGASGVTLTESTTLDLGGGDFGGNATQFYLAPPAATAASNALTIQNGTNVVLGQFGTTSDCVLSSSPCDGIVLGNEAAPAQVHHVNIGAISVSGGSTGKNVLSAGGPDLPTAACLSGFSLCSTSAASTVFIHPFGTSEASPPTLNLCGGSVPNMFVPGASNGETINTCSGGTPSANVVDVSKVGATATVNLTTPRIQFGGVTDTMASVQNVNGSDAGGVIIGNTSPSILTGGSGPTTFVIRNGSDTITGNGTVLSNIVDFSNPANAAVTVDLNAQTYTAGSASGHITGVGSVVGSSVGGDVFTPLFNAAATYTNPASTLNTINVAAAPSACSVTLVAPEALTCSGISDTFSDIQNVVGSNLGGTITGNASPSVLTGGNTGTTSFYLNGGADTILGSATATNWVSFQNQTLSGVNINLNTGNYSGFNSGTMFHVSSVTGSVTGGDTFTPNFTSGGSTYVGFATASHNRIDLSSAGCAALVDVSAATETVAGCGSSDNLTHVQDVLGTPSGPDLTTVSFAHASGGVTVNLNTGVYSGPSLAGSLSGITQIVGSPAGGDTFTPNFTVGGDFYNGATGPGISNTVSLAGSVCSATIDVTVSPETISGCGATDTGNGLQNVVGTSSTTVSFSSAAGPVVVNLSTATFGSVPANHYSIGGGTTYSITGAQNVNGSSQGDTIIGNTQPSTFNGGNAATTFVVNGGLDTIHGAAGFANVVDFHSASSGVTINLNAGTYTGFSSGTMTNVQSVIGSGAGGDTFTPNISGGNAYTGSATASHNRVDLSGLPCTATLDLSAAPETITGCGSPDQLTNVQDAVGVPTGSNATTVTFIHASGGVTINLNNGTYSGPSLGGTLSGINKVVGSPTGGDTFTPNFSLGGDTYTGSIPARNTLDMSSGPCAATVDVSSSPESVTGCGSVDTLTNTQNVIGVSGGVDATTVTFSHAGTGGVTINLDTGLYSGPGGLGGSLSGVNKVVGSPTGLDVFTPNLTTGGSSYTGTSHNVLDLSTAACNATVDVTASPETITGCGPTPDLVTNVQDILGTAATTVSFANASAAVTVNLSGSLFGSVAANRYQIGAGTQFKIIGVQNIIGSNRGDTIVGNTTASTFTGGNAATTFVVMGGLDTINGGPGVANVVDFSRSTLNNGVIISLATGQYGLGGASTGASVSNITKVLGSSGGGDTFTPAFSGSPSQYVGTGPTPGTLDVKGSGCSTTVVDLRPETNVPAAFGTVTCSGTGTTFATFSGIQNVVGSNAGGTIFGNATGSLLTGGTANTTFVFVDLTSGSSTISGQPGVVNTLDLHSASCAAGVTLTANGAGETLQCGTSNALANIQNVIGSSGANATGVSFASGPVAATLTGSGFTYALGSQAGTLTSVTHLTGAVAANSLNVASAGCPAVLDMSSPIAELLNGCGPTDTLANFYNITGIASGANQTAITFAGSSSGVTLTLGTGVDGYTAGTFSGTLTAITNVAGSASATNALVLTGAACPGVVDLSNQAAEVLTGCGSAVSLSGFQNVTGIASGTNATSVTFTSATQAVGLILTGPTAFTYSNGLQGGSLVGVSRITGSGTGANSLDVSSCSVTVDLSNQAAATITGCGSTDTLSAFQDIIGAASGPQRTTVTFVNAGHAVTVNLNTGTYVNGTQTGTLASVTFIRGSSTGGDTYTPNFSTGGDTFVGAVAATHNRIDLSSGGCSVVNVTSSTEAVTDCAAIPNLLAQTTAVQDVVGNPGSTTVTFTGGAVAITLTGGNFLYALGAASGTLTGVTSLSGDPLVGGNSLNLSGAGCAAVLDLSVPGAELLNGCGATTTLANFANFTGISSGTNQTSVTFAGNPSGVVLTAGIGADGYTVGPLSGILTAITRVTGANAAVNTLVLTSAACPGIVDLSNQASESLTGCGSTQTLTGFQNVTGIPSGTNASTVTFASAPQGIGLVLTGSATFTYSNGPQGGALAGVSHVTGSGSSSQNTVDLSACLATIELSNQASESVTACGSTDTLSGFQDVSGAASGPNRTTVSFLNAGHGVTVNLNTGTYNNASQSGTLSNVTLVRGSSTGGDTYTPNFTSGGDTFLGSATATHNRVDLSGLGCTIMDITSATETVTTCAPSSVTLAQLTSVQDVIGNLGGTTVSFATAPGDVTIDLNAGTYTNGSKSGLLSGVLQVVGSPTGGDTFTPSYAAGTISVYAGAAGAVNTVDFSHAPAGAIINLNHALGTASVAVPGSAASVNLTNVQRVLGSTHGDTFTPRFGPVADTYLGSVNAGVTNVLDLSSATGGSTINLATGLMTGDWGATDTLQGIGRVLGGAFNEDLLPGPGNITFDGGAGSNTIDFSTAPATATINLATGTTSGGWGGTDTLINVQNAIGSQFDDLITGGPRPGVLAGLAGNDTFVPTGVDTVIDGGLGVNILDLSGAPAGVNIDLSDPSPQAVGGSGTVVLITGTIQVLKGPAPASHLSGGAGTVTLIGGNNGGNVLTGGSGTDILTAGSGGDTLEAGTGNDLLNGGPGNDYLVAGPGNDTFNGGGGNNTLDFSLAPSGVRVNISNSFYTAPGGVLPGMSITGGWGASDVLTGIQNVVGSSFDDILVGDAGTNVLNGLAGNDYIVGGGGGDTLISGAGNSTFVAGSGNNLIRGGPGDNTVDYSADPAGVNVDLLAGTASNGYGGQDTLSGIRNIIGSNFNDVLRLGALPGIITSGAGDDLLVASPAGGSTLIAGSGSDTLQVGAGGGNTLVAGSGPDVFFTRNGQSDTIVGGKAQDRAQIDPGQDSVSSSVLLLP